MAASLRDAARFAPQPSPPRVPIEEQRHEPTREQLRLLPSGRDSRERSSIRSRRGAASDNANVVYRWLFICVYACVTFPICPELHAEFVTRRTAEHSRGARPHSHSCEPHYSDACYLHSSALSYSAVRRRIRKQESSDGLTSISQPVSSRTQRSSRTQQSPYARPARYTVAATKESRRSETRL